MLRYPHALVAPAFERETYRRLAYLLIGGLLGACYLVAPVALSGLDVLPFWASWPVVPALLAISGFSVTLRVLERGLSNALLGTEIPTSVAPRAVRAPGRSPWRRARALLAEGTAWRTALWLALRSSLGLLAFGATVVTAVAVPALLVVPFADGYLQTATWQSAAGWRSAWTIPLALLAPLVLLRLTNLLARVHARLAPTLLGPSPADKLAALRERNERLAERNRLARELHDSVGHTMTVAVLQAAAARRVFDSDPEFARRALATIEDVGRDALDELDRTLGVLREEPRTTDAGTSGGAVGGARSGLDELDGLLARLRAAGLPVTASVSGDPAAVPEGVGREAYRIVQEGCTNVLRHAGSAPTSISVKAGGDSLEIIVANEPPAARGSEGPDGTGGGRGLRGVAERVGSLGGAFRAGPTQGGGYELRVVLPLGTASR